MSVAQRRADRDLVAEALAALANDLAEARRRFHRQLEGELGGYPLARVADDQVRRLADQVGNYSSLARQGVTARRWP